MMNEELLEQVVKMLEQQTERIELKIELEVSKKIEALFDGYKLTHEKQWELEKKMAELERRIENLEINEGYYTPDGDGTRCRFFYPCEPTGGP